MKRLVPLVLLAFTAGGTVAPAVHRAVHAAESTAERHAHQAAGHHHHDAADAHGVEWTLPCDRPVELDELACVLCKGLNADSPRTTPAEFAHADEQAVVQRGTLLPAAYTGEAAPARGPPHRIV